MAEYPSGTITFLFTDIEDSSTLWESYPQAMQTALERHDALLKKSLSANNGFLIKTTGDGIHAAFENASDAVRMAAAAQISMNEEPWGETGPIKIRIGMHTGEAQLREGDYYGPTLNQAARIMSIGHGGQVLLSQVTASVVQNQLPDGFALADLGTHRLKGITRPEQVYQLNVPGLAGEFPVLRSQNLFQYNLPVMPTPFVGRQDQLNALRGLLLRENVRLVTLSGPGGMGKTRLSLETGGQLLEQFPDGVVFVDLAPITDEDLVATTITRAMGIREGGGQTPLEMLKDYLLGRRLLLILDNFEQITQAAHLVAEVLAAAPQVKVLATSRILLNLRGEHEFVVSPLSLPEKAGLTPEKAMENESVALFMQQAQAAKPSFELTADNVQSVVAICQRLDGLPLALEIAAARIKLLPPDALLKRMEHSLNVLVGGAKDLPTRQQTLRSTIDWSYDLLSPQEQRLFACLGVFVGGFTLESAAAVCDPGGDLDALAGIETLLNNSLVRNLESVIDEPRFMMLHTIQEYALEKLGETGEEERLQEAHATYMIHYANQAGPHIYSNRAIEWLFHIEEENDNFRKALAWLIDHPEKLFGGIEIVFQMVWFWYRYGHIREGREWSVRLLKVAERMPGTPSHGMALGLSALMAMWSGELDVAAEHGPRCLEILRGQADDRAVSMMLMNNGVIRLNRGEDKEAYPYLVEAIEMMDNIGDNWSKATSMVHLANVALGLGRYDEAMNWLDQAMVDIKRLGDEWQIAFALNNYGEIARAQGDYASAEPYYRETEALYREADAIGDHARLIHTLGYIELHQGELAKAEGMFRTSLDMFRELGSNRGMAECLAGLASLAAARGSHSWATALLGAADHLLTSFGAAWWPADRVEIVRTQAQLKAALEANEYTAHWQQGQGMSLDGALDYAAQSIPL